MRQIIPATFAHVNFITDLLVREYQKLNAELGTAFYQSDAEHLASHVDARIQEDGAYKYFVLVDEQGELLDYLSLLVMKQKGEILMIGVKENENADELEKELLVFWVEYLKKQGTEYILFEVASHEEFFRNCVQNIGAKILATRFVLS